MDVRLVAETTAVAPGSTLTLAFAMRPERGWHGYWRNPGDAGAEPRVQWRLPEGWRPAYRSVEPGTVRGGIIGQAYDEAHQSFERRQAADVGMRFAA